MKNRLLSLILIVVLAFIAMPNDAQALPKLKMKKYNEAVTINPVSLVFNVFDATYERVIKDKNSFYIQVLTLL